MNVAEAKPGTEQPKLRWTRDEAATLVTLFPDQRYELIEGELINKTGQRPPHAYVVMKLNEILSGAFPGRVRIQLPIALPDPDGQYSEPEPDAVVLHETDEDFASKHPAPEDIVTLIEVAESSLERDLTVKAALYARTRITEYWVVDIENRRIIIHRHPARDGYGSVTRHSGHNAILSLLSIRIPADSILPACSAFISFP